MCTNKSTLAIKINYYSYIDQIFSSNEAEQHVDCLENSPTAREDDKTSCSRATSVVSSLAESEGPAEWSVDEMDDGDTLFLVTSSENKMHNVQPGKFMKLFATRHNRRINSSSRDFFYVFEIFEVFFFLFLRFFWPV